MAFQLGSALMDACVLAVLNRGDTYGYVLTQQVREIMDISESTLYPVLRRLQKDGCLETYDQSFQVRNRRYYKVTEKGKEKNEEYIKEWEGYKVKIDKILLGGMGNE